MSAGHVVVVGGGVVGLACAWSALRKGFAVTVLERGAPGDAGCSHGNAGLLVPSHVVPLAAPGMVAQGLRYMLDAESPFFVRPRLDLDLVRWCFRFWRAGTVAHVERSAPLLRDMHLASREAFAELAADAGDFGLVRSGLLVLCETGRGLDDEARAAEFSRRLGLPAEVLDAAGVAARLPGVRVAAVGGVFHGMDGRLDPSALVTRLRERVTALGGTLRHATEATAFRLASSQIVAVQTPAGEVAGDAFVLAGGSWSPALMRPLGVRLPLQAGKGYSVTLDAPAVMPELPLLLAEAHVAVTPLGSRLRFGGTMELAGLDTGIAPSRVRGIVRAAVRALPDFRAEHFATVPAWCGLRPCSPDGLPYLGRFTRHANLLAATGHAMMGVSLAPITGRLVAQLLAGETPEIDVGALSPERHG